MAKVLLRFKLNNVIWVHIFSFLYKSGLNRLFFLLVDLIICTTNATSVCKILIEAYMPTLMGKHLQGVEGGIDHKLCLRHLTPDGVSKAKEERIAAGEDDKGNPSPCPSP